MALISRSFSQPYTLPSLGFPSNQGHSMSGCLYSTVQMPPGVPVATVGIDGARMQPIWPAKSFPLNIWDCKKWKISDQDEEVSWRKIKSYKKKKPWWVIISQFIERQKSSEKEDRCFPTETVYGWERIPLIPLPWLESLKLKKTLLWSIDRPCCQSSRCKEVSRRNSIEC